MDRSDITLENKVASLIALGPPFGDTGMMQDEFLQAVSRFALPYVEECARRLRKNPRDPDALFVRAAILACLDQTVQAIACLDELARVDPHYPGLWHFKARLYADMGDTVMHRLCLETARREARAWSGVEAGVPVP